MLDACQCHRSRNDFAWASVRVISTYSTKLEFFTTHNFLEEIYLMLKTTALIAGSLVLGVSVAAFADTPQRLVQAQVQNRSPADQDYQNRMRAAKTAEERSRIQAEYDQRMQQGAVPDNSDDAVRSAPGTAGSGAVPSNRTSPFDTAPGLSPGGGGSVPRGQSGD
jgi:hypothetical protein